MGRLSVGIFAAVALLSGCSSPTNPSATRRGPIDVSGTWVTAESCINSGGLQLAGCPIVMKVTQSGSALSGTFTEEGLGGGSLIGTVVNTTMSVALTYAVDPECPLKLSGA